MIGRENKIKMISEGLIRNLKKTILKYKIHFVLLISLSILVSSYQGKVISLQDTSEERHQEIFSHQIENYLVTKELINSDYFRKNPGMVTTFYSRNHNKPFWTINYSLNNNANEYINLLSNAGSYGLSAEEYFLEQILVLKKKLIDEKNYIKLTQLRIELELLLTCSSLRFSNALEHGVLYERSLTNDISINERIETFFKNSDHLVSAILKSQPQNIQYKRLQKALEKLVRTTDNEILKAQQLNSEIIEKINKTAYNILSILYITDPDLNEANLKTRVKIFQKDQKIRETGILDKATRLALVKIYENKYAKIAVNLERLRQEQWSSDIYILVNIPAFKLIVYENNKQVADYKTIIGKPLSPTPVFSGKIEKIVTNPSWIVPQSISSKEILYRAKKDTTFLSRNKYVVFDKNNNVVDPASIKWNELNASNFDYKIIQQSSAGNALGKIKFLFPNKYSVYVHDTPSKRLFNSSYRAYSHGCVRLENPHFLAEYIIKKQEEPNLDKHLKRNLNKGIQEIFKLSHPIEIHLRYYTCEADEEGRIYFYNDIYDLDNEILQKIKS